MSHDIRVTVPLKQLRKMLSSLHAFFTWACWGLRLSSKGSFGPNEHATHTHTHTHAHTHTHTHTHTYTPALHLKERRMQSSKGSFGPNEHATHTTKPTHTHTQLDRYATDGLPH